jgi:hypothetical protein
MKKLGLYHRYVSGCYQLCQFIANYLIDLLLLIIFVMGCGSKPTTKVNVLIFSI